MRAWERRAERLQIHINGPACSSLWKHLGLGNGPEHGLRCLQLSLSTVRRYSQPTQNRPLKPKTMHTANRKPTLATFLPTLLIHSVHNQGSFCSFRSAIWEVYEAALFISFSRWRMNVFFYVCEREESQREDGSYEKNERRSGREN